MLNNLKAIRKEKGLASWGLSVKSGVSTSTLTAIEKWSYVPGEETQRRIASALGVTAAAIWEPMPVKDTNREDVL
jgi:lambda repressor-like predicted transcriptional regulator